MTCPYRVGKHQQVTFAGSIVTVADGFAQGVNTVRVVLTSAGFVSFDGFANTKAYMPANWPEYFVVSPGQKASAIQATAGGDMYVTEMTR